MAVCAFDTARVLEVEWFADLIPKRVGYAAFKWLWTVLKALLLRAGDAGTTSL